jgi:hypothetical protein
MPAEENDVARLDGQWDRLPLLVDRARPGGNDDTSYRSGFTGVDKPVGPGAIAGGFGEAHEDPIVEGDDIHGI